MAKREANVAVLPNSNPLISSSDRESMKDNLFFTSSPLESIAGLWHEIHGARDWAGLLHPLHPLLRQELIKYGGFAQATYDGFDTDPSSHKCGSCRFGQETLFSQLGLSTAHYEVTRYLYATSRVKMLSSVARLKATTTWRRNSNWMGFVAVSSDEESQRIGRRDIVVAWRGTLTATEWIKNVQLWLKPLCGTAKVIHGFHSVYTSMYKSTPQYDKTSASEQFMNEVTRLVGKYRGEGEELSLTVTGHSLGGALAILSAYEAAAAKIPGLSRVSVFTFGAPLVGNKGFARELENLGVKVLRVVSKQDLVPKLPGTLLKRVYSHAGVVLSMDTASSLLLRRSLNHTASFHSLDTYLHFLEAIGSEARRDLALVNKSLGVLRKELSITAHWCWLKGLCSGQTWWSCGEGARRTQPGFVFPPFIFPFPF
ncbi:alpha/beta-Hydrolases superfamily protein [Wolffia australiana]